MTALVTFLPIGERAPEKLTLEMPRLDLIDYWFEHGYILYRNTYYPMTSVQSIVVYP